MKKLSPRFLPLVLSILPSALAAGELSLDLTCEIPAPTTSLTDTRVVARLYEYDPRLADVSADEVDRVVLDGLDLQKSRKSILRFPLGTERSDNRSYYVTVFVHPDEESKKRLYLINGFQKVFKSEDVESLEVKLQKASK